MMLDHTKIEPRKKLAIVCNGCCKLLGWLMVLSECSHGVKDVLNLSHSVAFCKHCEKMLEVTNSIN